MEVIKIISKRSKEQGVVRLFMGTLAFMLIGGASSTLASADAVFPNICSVVKSPEFRSCLDYSVSGCVCGFPPHPCANISYNVPQTFIEVWPDARDTFFSAIPGPKSQLLAHASAAAIPFGDEDDDGTFTFQARAIAVPFGSVGFSPLPCGGTRPEKPCFDIMSEDMGQNWSDGNADSLQPKFRLWALAPQACLLKGAASGFTGDASFSIGTDSGGCSTPIGSLPEYPPSSREACNGWGTFYPRSGVYQGGSRSGAALMIASRLKSLGIEVTHTLPGSPDETWQMIYPQSSSCFREGQNLGALETVQGLREEQRILAKPRGYLFVIWKKVNCCQEVPVAATSLASITALQAVCAATKGGV